MAGSLPLPKGYKRLGAFAIDEDSVFTTQAALDAYLAGGSSYPGQVVALVLDSENEAQVFKVNKDKSLGTIGGGGVSYEKLILIGHTIIPTAYDADVKISAIPKFTNLTDVKLVKSDATEKPLVVGGAAQNMPINVPAGDYEYRITYEAGKEAGVLLINF